MAWIARFAGWSAVLAIPAWLMMPPYQRMLASLASAALKMVGMEIQFEDVTVAAPMDLALFAAMCLASLHAPMPKRLRALRLGLPILAAAEVAVMVVVVLLTVATQRSASAQTSRVASYVLESIPWVNAAALWLALLGREELPDLNQADAAKSAPVRAARS